MTVTNPARPGWGDAWTIDDLQALPEHDQVYEPPAAPRSTRPMCSSWSR